MNTSSYGYGDHIGYLHGLNETIVCPYNPAHIVGVSRMQRHLHGCRQKNPKLAEEISICPYNQSHHIPTADISSHLVICRDHLAHKFQTLMRVGETKQGAQNMRSESVSDIGPHLPIRTEQEEAYIELRKKAHANAYYDDANAEDDDVSLCAFLDNGEQDTSDDRFRPFDPSVPAASVEYVQELNNDGKLWTCFEGEGYVMPCDNKKPPKQHQLMFPIKLPPCDQEEIDNWI